MRRRSVTVHGETAPAVGPGRRPLARRAPVDAGGATRGHGWARTPPASKTRSTVSDVVGRTSGCTYRGESAWPVAFDGGCVHDSQVGDEIQAVVTWR
jgi:hypothetical protein